MMNTDDKELHLFLSGIIKGIYMTRIQSLEKPLTNIGQRLNLLLIILMLLLSVSPIVPKRIIFLNNRTYFYSGCLGPWRRFRDCWQFKG